MTVIGLPAVGVTTTLNSERSYTSDLSSFSDDPCFNGGCHHFLVSATKLPEIVQLVFDME